MGGSCRAILDDMHFVFSMFSNYNFFFSSSSLSCYGGVHGGSGVTGVAILKSTDSPDRLRFHQRFWLGDHRSIFLSRNFARFRPPEAAAAV